MDANTLFLLDFNYYVNMFKFHLKKFKIFPFCYKYQNMQLVDSLMIFKKTMKILFLIICIMKNTFCLFNLQFGHVETSHEN